MSKPINVEAQRVAKIVEDSERKQPFILWPNNFLIQKD